MAVRFGEKEDLRHELKNIVSEPTAQHLFMVKTFADIFLPLYNIAATFCSALAIRDYAAKHGNINIHPPAVLYIDNLGISTPEKLEEGQDRCPATHFHCPRGFCIPTFLLSNGYQDCPYGQDENIANLTCPGFYRCLETGGCLHPDLFCDGISHCPLDDDERYCQAISCPAGCVCEGNAFRCHSQFPIVDFRFHLRYLDLSGYDKPTLDGADQALQLQFLNLSFCSLRNVMIPPMVMLRILDLSHNSISGLQSLNLISLLELQYLDISFNPLTDVLDHTFTSFLIRARLSKLQTLKMKNIGLHAITSKALGSLPRLSVLDLRLNIMDIPDKDVFGVFLQVLYADNPKLCCDYFHTIPLKTCHSSGDALSSCSDLLQSNALRVLLWVLCVLTETGNGGVLIYRAFLEQQGSSQAYKVFVINLSLADFLMGVYMAIIGGADICFRGDFVRKEHIWQNSATCKAAGIIAILSSEVSAFVISLITLDRFCLMHFPFNKRLRFVRFSAVVACVTVWIVGAIVATVPLSQSHWIYYCQNSICIPLPMTQPQLPGQRYAFGVFVVFNLILFIFIGIGQILIYHAIRSASMATQKDSRKQDIIIARRLFLIVFTDFCCWFPVGCMGLLAARGVSISNLLNVWAAAFFLPLNSAVNPFLYTINTMMQRHTRNKEKERFEKVMSRVYIEMRCCPHSEIVELLRHCRRHKLVEVKKGLDDEEDLTDTTLVGSL